MKFIPSRGIVMLCILLAGCLIKKKNVSSRLVLILILGFFVRVLDNVIVTISVCFVRPLIETREMFVSRKVHEVYVHLPIKQNCRSTRSSLIPNALNA